ncbi:hypothetical protein NO995_09200 [Aestuariibaculum sp. M13]|uniref:hypothetical protein n=1 Tax=Aestuariibaculum sp. M13 TaxID=2967132 RepID=UPI002159F6B7|nr:hypothetical protein [Aestuariibaculum sp. M13]MCR8667856.1 hypothetical protein [Aestuariibaculum sp. M13]
MNKHALLLCFCLIIIECQGQNGISISGSTNNTYSIDLFAIEGNNRFHTGYSHQFNGQHGNVEKEKMNESIETGKGKYFWACDFGYSWIFFNHLAIETEVSIGATKKYTNYKDNRDYIDDYSVITCRNLAAGVGVKLGYSFKIGFEPFIGFNTLKNVDFGARFFW